MKKLADAWQPLSQSLDANQKQRLRALSLYTCFVKCEMHWQAVNAIGRGRRRLETVTSQSAAYGLYGRHLVASDHQIKRRRWPGSANSVAEAIRAGLFPVLGCRPLWCRQRFDPLRAKLLSELRQWNQIGKTYASFGEHNRTSDECRTAGPRQAPGRVSHVN
jgi:hypothetical protein